MGTGRGRKGSGKRKGEGGRKGKGGDRDGRESLGGQGGREGKGVGKKGGEGKFRGARPPKCFFLEPRLYAEPL